MKLAPTEFEPAMRQLTRLTGISVLALLVIFFLSRLQAAGADRVIFGSSAPRTDLEFELKHFTQYVPPDTHPDFYGTNLLRALGEEP